MFDIVFNTPLPGLHPLNLLFKDSANRYILSEIFQNIFSAKFYCVHQKDL